jgi:transcriptional regulator with XRE-family HTH domain
MKEDIDYLVRNNVMEVLIECRKDKGITQADLAEQLGLKPTTVASWEQGKSLPNIQTLYRLAQYYHKTIGYMYGEGKKDG